MMNPWTLPTSLEVGGTEYHINADYRDVIEIIGYLNNPDINDYVKWRIAVGLFYDGEILPEHQQEAMEKMGEFISAGETPDNKPHPKLIDWEQDAGAIITDVNKVAGYEIRGAQFLHWWTFISLYRGIGEGQLSTIVSIRSKLAKHKKLEKWEQEYYRENREAVDFKTRYTQEELEEQERIKKLLE